MLPVDLDENFSQLRTRKSGSCHDSRVPGLASKRNLRLSSWSDDVNMWRPVVIREDHDSQAANANDSWHNNTILTVGLLPLGLQQDLATRLLVLADIVAPPMPQTIRLFATHVSRNAGAGRFERRNFRQRTVGLRSMLRTLPPGRRLLGRFHRYRDGYGVGHDLRPGVRVRPHAAPGSQAMAGIAMSGSTRRPLAGFRTCL